ncbi:MAG: complex I NDUFA9 subunit family protein [Candidatus Pelagibacter sp.]|tara:strand:- start:29 stop:976 length:948 start_codon:yes stop_codon:yes gene_type:complete
MKPKEILLLGASGQIGRNLIRKFTINNFKITAVTRNLHSKGYLLKTQGNPGYLEIEEANIFNEKELSKLLLNSNICINLIGILHEKKNNTFTNIHKNFPDVLSRLCYKNKIEQLIHVSALGVDKASDSIYAKSKLEGENIIKKNFPSSVILRPSLVYSIDDNFTTSFMRLLSFSPVFPLYYSGETKFTPIHVSDMTEIIFQIIKNNLNSKTIECIGPEIITFKEIMKKLLFAIKKKRLLIPTPLIIGNITANLMEVFMSNPLITKDQLRLLKYDNIASGNYKTNFDYKIPANLKFEDEINKYSYMWRESGQFAKN